MSNQDTLPFGTQGPAFLGLFHPSPRSSHRAWSSSRAFASMPDGMALPPLVKAVTAVSLAVCVCQGQGGRGTCSPSI